MKQEKRTSVIGALYGIAAFSVWGLLPAYWKLLQKVPPLEILSHRIVWSLVFVTLVLVAKGELNATKETLRSGKNRIALLLSAVIISLNWGTYIWAVNTSRIVESSLGYYISPLISILLGMLVFRERMNFWQHVAVALAAIGVAYMTLRYAKLPWVAIVLALSFSSYGLLKKMIPVTSLKALGIETLFISPFCLLFLGSQYLQQKGTLGHAELSTQALLVLAGVVTALPLLWFAQSAKMIPLSQVGFLQYIGPSLMLLLGVFIYDEPFTRVHAISFGCIWTALLLYSISGTECMKNLQPVCFRTTR
ncbi:MAG: EamA family transporter RarD [bacterium]|nr:EamA family transporter RarD [bacterium]